MIKRTILIESAVHMSIKNEQLIISNKESGEISSVYPPDIGIIIFDNREISYTHSVIEQLVKNNVAIVFCNSNHLPNGVYLNFDANYSQTLTFTEQLQIKETTKKRLWKEFVISKLKNQVLVLKKLKKDSKYIENLITKVKSGDSTNREGVAAKYYWKTIFGENFKREPDGAPPNNLLNYGYSILRSLTAKSLSGSGLLPLIGIHHHNQYNAFCLADDVMEPYRPFVDLMIFEYIRDNDDLDVNKKFKKYILELPVIDVIIGDLSRPLSIALTFTTSSLAKFIRGEEKELNLPKIKI